MEKLIEMPFGDPLLEIEVSLVDDLEITTYLGDFGIFEIEIPH